jgi:hypothetical protein
VSSLRNWKRYHLPGEKMENFMRSEPFKKDEPATAVTRKRKMTAGGVERAMLERRRRK